MFVVSAIFMSFSVILIILVELTSVGDSFVVKRWEVGVVDTNADVSDNVTVYDVVDLKVKINDSVIDSFKKLYLSGQYFIFKFRFGNLRSGYEICFPSGMIIFIRKTN